MLKTIEIAKREYFATVRAKSFLINLLLTPLVIALILFSTNKPDSTHIKRLQKISILDQIGILENEIKQVFSEYNQEEATHQVVIKDYIEDTSGFEQYKEKFAKEIQAGRLDAYFVIKNEDSNSNNIVMNCYSRKVTNSDLFMFDIVKTLIKKAVFYQKYKFYIFMNDSFESVCQNINIQHLSISGELNSAKNSNGIPDKIVIFIYMYIMYMGIFSTSQRMLTSLIEEKSTRIIEVLLSIVTPFQLIAGKVLGLVSVGVTLIMTWLGIAYFCLANNGIIETLSVSIICYFFIYFILGFLFLSSLMAAIGSVCNSSKDSHNFTVLISLIIAVPMILSASVFEKPDSILVTFLSVFPLTAPVTMVYTMLLSAEVNHFYAILTIFLMIGYVVIGIYLSAKIFRVGILMYGKSPKINEVLRWLKL